MKKSVILFFFFAITISLFSQDMYVRGEMNDWGTSDGPMVDDGTNGDAVAGDSIYTYTVTIATPGRYEWKVADADWTFIVPWAGGNDNSWVITTTENQEVVFTIDRSVHNDEFEPLWDIVNANDQLPTPTSDVVCAGDHNGWNNAGEETMYDDGENGDWEAGDGVLAFHIVQANAGTYSWKPVMSGTWDCWIAIGRTINSGNMQYITGEENEDVYCYLNLNTGRLATVLGAPLPVELTSFNAVANNENVIIKWQTATELNNDGFEIERKYENNNWETISFVDGNGTTSQVSSYSFTDKPGKTGLYSYRLKQIDYDGTFTYSGYVNVELTAPEKFQLSQNYPNPFNPSTTINYTIPETNNVTLKVYNVLGKEVSVLVNKKQESGFYEVSFDASSLASGIYFYTLNSGNNVSTRKMMLIK